MTQVEKLLAGMRSNPRTVRFVDLKRVLEHHGVRVRAGKGSHRVAVRGSEIYTIKDPGSASCVHPKTVKRCLQAFDLWE